jgi:RND family efflux transporter MFP subunit
MISEKQSKIVKFTILGVFLLFFLNSVGKYFFNKPPVPPLLSVMIEKPKIMKLTDYVTQTGTMVAFNSVDLVARIPGYLEAIQYTDGTFVKKGQTLFIVEPKPYLEQLKGAQASVAAEKATYAYSIAEYERQKRMYKQNATSLNNVEKWLATTQQNNAGIDKAVANAEIATINYSYTHILAPFDGRVGRHLVDTGNYVGNGKATDLATIEQLDPIYVYFNLNELDLIKVRQIAKEASFNPKNIKQVPVEVKMQNETEFSHLGKLNFVSTDLNASTGTIEFRGLLSNKDYTLLPGFFVQVRIPITKPTPQLTVPSTAVQYDQIGPYLLTVDEKNKVVTKRVVTGAVEKGRRAIEKGLLAEDNVVVLGLQNAIPGSQVLPVLTEKKV